MAQRSHLQSPYAVEELAQMMVDHDLELASREKTLKDAGHELPEFSGHDQ